jgi:hypothetical protein
VMPGIHNLADVAELYGVAAASARPVVLTSVSDTAESDRARAVVVARARRTRSARTV